jgi:hypothetical protein
MEMWILRGAAAIGHNLVGSQQIGLVASTAVIWSSSITRPFGLDQTELICRAQDLCMSPPAQPPLPMEQLEA